MDVLYDSALGQFGTAEKQTTVRLSVRPQPCVDVPELPRSVKEGAGASTLDR